jgi:hypothetical protein
MLTCIRKDATKIQRKKHNDSLLRQKNKEKSLEHLIFSKIITNFARQDSLLKI